MITQLRSWLIVLALGLAVWLLPCPEGLSPNAWTLFAVFVATIAGFILQPIPMGAVAFLSLTFSAKNYKNCGFVISNKHLKLQEIKGLKLLSFRPLSLAVTVLQHAYKITKQNLL